RVRCSAGGGGGPRGVAAVRARRSGSAGPRGGARARRLRGARRGRRGGGGELYTAQDEDEYGRRATERLKDLGVEVRGATRAEPTRRAVTLVDDDGERTITTFGPRLEPRAGEGGEWSGLTELDAVYFTAGDEAALRLARGGAP